MVTVPAVDPPPPTAAPALQLVTDRVAPSQLLQYLPELYQGDSFIGRFLRIFEDIHDPIRRMASGLPQYFDAPIAPPELQDRLAEWVGESRDGPLAALPRPAWGRLVRESIELHRWRGTRRGLRRALEIATGHTPLISDSGAAMVLGDDASLGSNTRLEHGAPFEITVTFECDPDEIDTRLVDAMIRRYRPAHVAHTVAFAPARRG